MVTTGSSFPSFTLQNQHGQAISLPDLAGSPAVIYFYPKDDTSGCTAEACEFQERLPQFKNVRVIGVSPDSVASHLKFAKKYNLDFDLLADTEKLLCEACGIWVEKSMYGKKYMGVERTSYLLDSNGFVVRVWNKVKPQGHAEEVHAALKELV